ncbi:TusE/DsrC/DsvC family sulfur relay protein [Neptuniibacter sp.]|uniref:TusE/DsrC/DsvC family sulfur relay protein n=1 Tax=Neptuniibacter sp. TaxID=1962643 RepID=UPI003B5B114C
MSIEVDAEGYLRNLDDWSPDIAKQLAEAEGIVLSPDHWELIKVIRDFYNDYEHSPAMRPLVKAVKINLGEDKGKSIYLMKLFPGSPAKLLAKIAGLPKPDNCL